CEAIGAEFTRKGDKVDELHPLVAERTGYRGSAFGIFIDEPLDHALAEAAFVVEHVVREAEPVGDCARIVNVLTRAAGSGTLHGFSVVVELHRNADDFGSAASSERSRDGAVDAAGHGDDDPRALKGFEAEIGDHCRCGDALYPN